MPKDLTPHQVSRGLSYVQKDPPFLAKLKKTKEETDRRHPKFENYHDGQDDDDYDELEGAQVVELNAAGKEVHKDTGEPEDDKEEEQDNNEPEQAAVDEQGRILFQKKKSKKRKAEDDDSKEKEKDVKGSTDKKKKKKNKSAIKLSFDEE